MRKVTAMTVTAALLAVLLSGCVISIRESSHHHPDRCYDCHYAWELDRWDVDVSCVEFEIVVVSDGYWYKPLGADDSQKKFHLLKAHDAGTILGPAMPQRY